MKGTIQTYVKKILKLKESLHEQQLMPSLWRDWYIILGLNVTALFILFVVGAYSFFVTVRVAETREATSEYHPPVSEDVLVQVSTQLRARTEQFFELQESLASVPVPGVGTGDEQVSEDVMSLPEESGGEVDEDTTQS